MAAAPPTPLGQDPFVPAVYLQPGVLNGRSLPGIGACGPAGFLGHQYSAAHAKKRHRQPAAYLFPVRTGDLAVSPGQITFEAEGNDQQSSPFFSRKIIWPGKASDGVGNGSGVTIGRGYDMGDRTEKQVAADLVAAGMDAKTAAAFAAGAGKKGPGLDDVSAQGFVKNHREELGAITPAVQKKLFEDIYPTYVKLARDRYAYHATPKAVLWEQLKPAIRDVLVDLVYQGFGAEKKGYGRPLQAGMHNDYHELIGYITASHTLSLYEAGRHRADYLRAALAKEEIAQPAATIPTAAVP